MDTQKEINVRESLLVLMATSVRCSRRLIWAARMASARELHEAWGPGGEGMA